MSEHEQVERDRKLILEARERGRGATLKTYAKLSGPGWLQGAITLGGGSLGGSLYLGVLAGFGLLWLQPLAMIMGIIMLVAISHVVLSTGERPFDAINRHISPVLGWGWAIATLLANLVWCLPQFALGTAAIRQNLAPGIFGDDAMGPIAGKLVAVVLLLAVSVTVIWFYESGGRGLKLFEFLLKAMVGVIVLCFVGVVVKMAISGEGLVWAEVAGGFVPDFSLLFRPSPEYAEFLAATGQHQDFWREEIVNNQQKVMITAAATAVGINMTFLFPYSMLRRGWDRDFRGLAVFDLSIGLFIPFVLATSCVVIAAASQFHAQEAVGFLGETNEQGAAVQPAKNLVGAFNGLIDKRVRQQVGDAAFQRLKEPGNESELAAARSEVPDADRRMAAMLVKRDAFNLAASLERLTGRTMSHVVFGIGVLGMAVSTIIILMLINGFVVCEMLGLPARGTAHRVGCLLVAASGSTGPFLWSTDARVWLVVPTSMFGMVLLPIAYFTFLLMINSKQLMGDQRPRGGRRVAWNLLMGTAATLAALGSIWSIKSSDYPRFGFAALAGFVALAVVVHFVRRPGETSSSAAESQGDS